MLPGSWVVLIQIFRSVWETNELSCCFEAARKVPAHLDACGPKNLPERRQLLTNQITLLDTVSTTCGSGWVNLQFQNRKLTSDPPATAGGTDRIQAASLTLQSLLLRTKQDFSLARLEHKHGAAVADLPALYAWRKRHVLSYNKTLVTYFVRRVGLDCETRTGRDC
jgi:hypothetical protein